MHHFCSVSVFRPLSVSALLLLLLLPLGCKSNDHSDAESITYETPIEETPAEETSNALQAVMTVEIDDDLVEMGLNPDLRPPLHYQFSGVESLNQDGVPITDPMAGLHELSWDFGDSLTERFSPSKSTVHIYREEGTFTANLFLREGSGETDTAQVTIDIGPAWLEIMDLTTVNRPDGGADVSVIVRNQSNQDLRVITVELHVDGSIMPSNLSATFGPGTVPEYLGPNATYTLTSSVGEWTGDLKARSSFCTPLQ